MNDDEIIKTKGETNIFIQLLHKYLPFWPLFILTISTSLIFSILYLRTQIPMYVVSAKVLLKDPNKGGGDSKVLDALNIFSDKKIVENELIVLRSSSILQQVASNIDLYSSVYIDGKS